MSRWFALLLLASLGCEQPVALPPEPPTTAPVSTGGQFMARSAGRVQGTIRWRGPLPAVAALESVDQPLELASLPVRPRPNPHAPRVAGERRGLAGAFVWLEGIDPARAPPWDPDPVTLTIQDRQFTPDRLLMRQGDPLTLRSRDPFHHTLQGRGAHFFSVTLPRPEVPRSRTMDRVGVVEVRSGSGAFWSRAYVLVQPHPFAALTDDEGRFAFDRVPPGSYELHAWHPNPQVIRRERSPDTRRVIQVFFGEPFTARCPIVVETARTARPELSLGGVR